MLPKLQPTPHGYTNRKVAPADLLTAVDKTEIREALGREFSVAKVSWAELQAETMAPFSKASTGLETFAKR
jgi:hypothetical protein